MDSTSLKFLFLFLPLFIILYLIARNELRLLLITVANVVFLLWGQQSAILWLSLILVTSYSLGLYLSSEKGSGKAWLWVGRKCQPTVLADPLCFLLKQGR